MRKRYWLGLVVGALVIASAFCFGAATVKPQVITEICYVPYEITVIKEVEIVKEIEIEKPIELKGFLTVEELEDWLAKDKTNAIHLVSGRYPEDGVWIDPDYDCDDYAVTLMNNALDNGYLMSVQLNGDHMINSTIIGNEIYFIEPQNDKVWLWGYRD